MALFDVAYRLRIYAPLSVAPLGNQVLTPASGAAHGDPFAVATVQGESGFKPYLKVSGGPKGKIDPLTCKVESSSLSFSVMDARLGATNAVRWATAFVSGADLRSQFLGLVVACDERQADGTWAPYFVGKIQTAKATPTAMEFTARDGVDDMKDLKLFSQFPLAQAGAGFFSLMPAGLVNSYGGSGVVPPLVGNFRSSPPNVLNPFTKKPMGQDYTSIGARYLELPKDQVFQRYDNVCSLEFFTGKNPFRDQIWFAPEALRVRFFAPGNPALDGREAWCTYAPLQNMTLLNGGTVVAGKLGGTRGFSIKALWMTPLKVTDAAYVDLNNLSAIPDGTKVGFACYRHSQDGKAKTSFFVPDVSLADMIGRVCSGYFGYAYKGQPRVVFPYTVAASIAGDATLARTRWLFEKETNVAEFLEKQVCVPFGIGYIPEPWYDGNGAPKVRLRFFDRRLASVPSIASLPVLTEDDLVSDDPPDWGVDRSRLIGIVRAKVYSDKITDAAKAAWDPNDRLRGTNKGPKEWRSIGDQFLESQAFPYLDLEVQPSGEIASKTYDIDAVGIRASTDETLDGTDSDSWLVARAKQLAAELRPFVTGGMQEGVLTCRRTAVVRGIQPGQWVRIQETRMPNTETRTRGGERLALCMGRQDSGATLQLRFLIAGSLANGAPARQAPTLSGYSKPADRPDSAQFTVALNAAGDPARLYMAVTDAAATSAPTDSATAWVAMLCQTAAGLPLSDLDLTAGTYTLPRLPLNKRVWIRAVSVAPASSADQLPSAPAYPTGTASVDGRALAAPSGLAAGGLTSRSATLIWTNTTTTERVQVLFASPSTAQPQLLAELPANTASYALSALNTGLNASFKATVRYVLDDGRTGAEATITFTTGTAPAAAAAPSIAGVSVVRGLTA